jgi:hypothetical protein
MIAAASSTAPVETYTKCMITTVVENPAVIMHLP